MTAGLTATVQAVKTVSGTLISALMAIRKKYGMSEREIIAEISQKYNLTEDEAVQKINQFLAG